MENEKLKAPRNRTIALSESERVSLRKYISILNGKIQREAAVDKVFNQDYLKAVDYLPDSFVDLLFADPPYNICKKFNSSSFKQISCDDYAEWLDSWLSRTARLLMPTATIYICGDWRSSGAIQKVCEKYFKVRNRITFERDKGRGAKFNWKNNSEDIWFCTVSDDYFFNADAVKLKRRVIAPYRENGNPKDWSEESGEKFRLTHPSNLWTDMTMPFWSMPENTPHPTQKPEKLLAKIILASTRKNDMILDPFAGVGTTGVVAKKLGRKFALFEIDEEYCLYALKRIALAKKNKTIQGYENNVFYERNVFPKK